MKEEDIKTGDVYLVNGRNEKGKQTFLSKAIDWWMKVYAKKYNIKYDWIGSHAATFLWIGKNLYLGESIDNGFHIRKFKAHYDFEKDDFCVLKPIKPYTEEEQEKIVELIISLQVVNVFYKYTNFIFWPIYIVFGINLFGKTRKFTYCYESTDMIMKEMNRSVAKDIYVSSFFDLYNNENYKKEK